MPARVARTGHVDPEGQAKPLFGYRSCTHKTDTRDISLRPLSTSPAGSRRSDTISDSRSCCFGFSPNRALYGPKPSKPVGPWAARGALLRTQNSRRQACHTKTRGHDSSLEIALGSGVFVAKSRRSTSGTAEYISQRTHSRANSLESPGADLSCNMQALSSHRGRCSCCRALQLRAKYPPPTS